MEEVVTHPTDLLRANGLVAIGGGLALFLAGFLAGNARAMHSTPDPDEGTFSKRLVGDFNGDSIDDMLVVGPSPNNPVTFDGSGKRVPAVPDGCDTIAYGHEDGTFTAGEPAIGTDAPGFVGDFNGDGKDDVLFHGGTTSSVFYGKLVPSSCEVNTALHYPWQRDHDFGSPQAKCFLNPSGATGITPAGTPLVGDFNGDGRDDVFLHSTTGALERVWSAETTGQFTASLSIWPLGAASDTPILTNMDGNAYQDIVLVPTTGPWDTVRWFPGKAVATNAWPFNT